MSTESHARRDGTRAGTKTGRAAAAPIKINPDQVADYALKLAAVGQRFDHLRTLLLDPGLSSVIGSDPGCLWASMSAQDALTTSNGAFAGVARRTTALGYLFAQVDAAQFGTGVPKRSWESYLAGQSKKHGVLGFLDRTNKLLEHDLHGLSLRDAQGIHDLLNLPRATADLAGHVTVAGVNAKIRKALDGGTGRAARARARQALVDALGKDVVGAPNRARASAIVNEWVEHGSYGDLDELLARLHTRGALPLTQIDKLRGGLLGASGRMARQAEALQAALRVPGAKAAALVISRLKALEAGGGRLGGLTGQARAARRATAARMEEFVTKNIAGRGGLGRAVAKVGLRGGAEAGVAIVLLPFDVYTAFTASTKLGKTAGAAGAIAGTATVLAVATSWTGVGGVGFGTIALVATGVSVAATGADAANQYHQRQIYVKAYGKAFQTAAGRAYAEAIRAQLQDELGAANARYTAHIASRAAVPTSRPVSAQQARAQALAQFSPAFLARAA